MVVRRVALRSPWAAGVTKTVPPKLCCIATRPQRNAALGVFFGLTTVIFSIVLELVF